MKSPGLMLQEIEVESGKGTWTFLPSPVTTACPSDDMATHITCSSAARFSCQNPQPQSRTPNPKQDIRTRKAKPRTQTRTTYHLLLCFGVRVLVPVSGFRFWVSGSGCWFWVPGSGLVFLVWGPGFWFGVWVVGFLASCSCV